MRLRPILGLLLLLGCGSGAEDPVRPGPASAVEKCERMCQSYCVHKHMCDGTAVQACRRAIDEADGGTCAERAALFAEISQQRVDACIAAVEAMSCVDFLRMYSTGTGIPGACEGILF